ncbi:MAG: hypothetical protein ACRC5H_08905 [Treponemataceae bacterium]
MNSSAAKIGLLARAKNVKERDAKSYFKSDSEAFAKISNDSNLLYFFEAFAQTVKSPYIKNAGVLIKTQQAVGVLFSKGFLLKAVKKINRVPFGWATFFSKTEKKCWQMNGKSLLHIFASIFPLNDYSVSELDYFVFDIESTSCCFFLNLTEQSERKNICTDSFISDICVQTQKALALFSFPNMLSFYAKDFLTNINYGLMTKKNAFSFSLFFDMIYTKLLQKISPADAENFLLIIASSLSEFIGPNNIVFLVDHKLTFILFSTEAFQTELIRPIFNHILLQFLGEQYLQEITFTDTHAYVYKDEILKLLPSLN